MTNKEKYKQAFSVVKASEGLRMEDIMKNKKSYLAKRIAVAAAALSLGFFGSNGICYAATGETWVEKVIVMVNGEQREATVLETEDGRHQYEINLDPMQDGDNYVEPTVILDMEEGQNIEDVEITYGENGENGCSLGVTIVDEAPEE